MEWGCLINPTVAFTDAFQGSLKLTSPLVALIKSEDVNATADCSITAKLHRELHQFNRAWETQAAELLYNIVQNLL